MEEKKCVVNTFFEKVKGIFGEPDKGIHSYRLFNIAYMDVIFTIIGAYLLQKLLFPKTPYIKVLFYLFLLGIVLHRLFNVRTTIYKILF